ncbi:hypothetical protein [Desulfopila sp. IMCC35008]|uniref:hypothetical protein n=1 Tax=Desulfopila sp. IMCC35008 TaxID=2653858 RepID=UPI0013D7B712|nr:hypothetical protein [Desulfopila sp. IMCC35008]
MRIKTHLLCMLLVILLTPLFASAQDDNSMERLQRDLNWYLELVNDEDSWCVEASIFFNEPRVMHRNDVVNQLIFFLNGPGEYSGYTLADALKIVSERSQAIKANIRQTTIPDIENRIRAHRAANFKPSHGIEYCGGVMTTAYLTTINNNWLRPIREHWSTLPWKHHSSRIGRGLAGFTQSDRNEANFRIWQNKVNCLGGCFEQRYKTEKELNACFVTCVDNNQFINCNHMK